MKKLNFLLILLFVLLPAFLSAATKTIKTDFAKGTITIKPVARNAVRVQYAEGNVQNTLPEWIYVRNDEVEDCNLKVVVDKKRQTLRIKDARGKVVFVATNHQMQNGKATLAISSPKDECLYGLGQFQDGYSNVRGLSRRLTQVNTQISLPMLLSSKGYGILWNNCGMTEYNPSDHFVKLTKGNDGGVREEVDVTSTEGGKREVREHNFFEAVIDVAEAGDYSLLLDVGQKMARRHNLVIDGQTVINMQNMWLPPTASQIVHLEAGKHNLRAELTRNDAPVVYYH
jgi:alpha-D-xyloside xylohydrolase